MSPKRIKILVAKPGLDGHDVGAKVIVRALAEAQFDVVYSGLRQTPEAIAEAARAEDVDVIGLSILSGSHMPLCERLRELFVENGLQDKLWIVGGNIPLDDHQKLNDIGYAGVFSTGSRLDNIVDFIREHAP